MSATLVETLPLYQPHQIRVKDPRQPHHEERSLAVSLASPPIPYPASAEEKVALQLSHLASQHHGSEYNRMKFGPKGCPIAYIPLSIHMPDYVKELQARQTKYTQENAWWPCQKHADPAPSLLPADMPVMLGPCGLSVSTDLDLQQEISAAISESLPQVPSNTAPLLQVKTSDSHPINISSIIPPESLLILSAQLVSPCKPSPVMFDIPVAHSLDRITGFPTPATRTEESSVDRIIPFSRHSISITTSMTPLLTHWRTRSSVTEAIQAAINSGLATAARELVNPVLSTSISGVSLGSDTSPCTKPTTQSVYRQRKLDDCDKLLIGRTPEPRACSAPPTVPEYPMDSQGSQTGTEPSRTWRPAHASDQQTLVVVSSPTPTQVSLPFPSPRNSSTSRTMPQTFTRPKTPSTSPLGNMLLSSCPGKKVRLSGPVKGRSGVCRDLRTDLKRMRELGVGCVVCCLDDNELEFLGVPWPEYSQAGQEMGIDILRIPIPEGLTPTSPSFLDFHLTHLIKTYTLQGVPILAHCRGGVGRAGLIACCWILKLGLCGWIETDLRYRLKNGTKTKWSNGDINACGEGGVRRDTLQLVERVISVVRRRRSVKAVETYEQVKFLVDFVEYLREAPMGGDVL